MDTASEKLLQIHQERAAQLKCSMLMMENSVGLLCETKKELNDRIDASIADLEKALRLKRDRRIKSEKIDNERRDGFDRRDGVDPAKK